MRLYEHQVPDVVVKALEKSMALEPSTRPTYKELKALVPLNARHNAVSLASAELADQSHRLWRAHRSDLTGSTRASWEAMEAVAVQHIVVRDRCMAAARAATVGSSALRLKEQAIAQGLLASDERLRLGAAWERAGASASATTASAIGPSVDSDAHASRAFNEAWESAWQTLSALDDLARARSISRSAFGDTRTLTSGQTYAEIESRIESDLEAASREIDRHRTRAIERERMLRSVEQPKQRLLMMPREHLFPSPPAALKRPMLGRVGRLVGKAVRKATGRRTE